MFCKMVGEFCLTKLDRLIDCKKKNKTKQKKNIQLFSRVRDTLDPLWFFFFFLWMCPWARHFSAPARILRYT